MCLIDWNCQNRSHSPDCFDRLWTGWTGRMGLTEWTSQTDFTSLTSQIYGIDSQTLSIVWTG